MNKLGIDDITGLVKFAIQNGLTSLEESSFPYTINQTFPIDTRR
jgi:hypothetical protein